MFVFRPGTNSTSGAREVINVHHVCAEMSSQILGHVGFYDLGGFSARLGGVGRDTSGSTSWSKEQPH